MLEAAERLALEGDTPSSEDIRFSYSRPEQPLWQRALIRGIEMASGQPKLERLYRGWAANRPAQENIFAAGVRLLGLHIETNEEVWRKVPASGPVLFIANHPFGVADGLMIGDLATRVRPDSKLMTHSLLCQPPEARDYLLPVDFGGTPEAQATSVLTRRRTLDWLNGGHSVVVFPAGGVSTAQQPLTGPALESAWYPFIAKLARLPGLTIVPVYFHGQNSRLFQIASHLHYMLRIALIFRETARRTGSTFRVTVGEPFPSSALPTTGDRSLILAELRRRTLALGGDHAPHPEMEFRWPRHINIT
jgi:putative hemolysin